MTYATMMERKQTFEDAVLKATRESASSGNRRYIHHRADGEFVVFDYSTVGTVAVAQPDGTLIKRTEGALTDHVLRFPSDPSTRIGASGSQADFKPENRRAAGPRRTQPGRCDADANSARVAE